MRFKHYCILSTLFFILTSTSCLEIISIGIRILSLDTTSDDLEIEFTFPAFEHNLKITNIKIYKDDTLAYELETLIETNIESEKIAKWTFPLLSNEYSIKYPENATRISKFKKSDQLRFEFKGAGKYSAYTSWQYEPRFSEKKYRWLFDEEGYKKMNIDCIYEPWVGKDLIKIVTNNDFNFDLKSFELLDNSRKNLDFELKSRGDTTNLVILVLKKNKKEGESMILSFNTRDGERYEEEIIVPSKSMVGLLGKYSDL